MLQNKHRMNINIEWDGIAITIWWCTKTWMQKLLLVPMRPFNWRASTFAPLEHELKEPEPILWISITFPSRDIKLPSGNRLFDLWVPKQDLGLSSKVPVPKERLALSSDIANCKLRLSSNSITLSSKTSARVMGRYRLTSELTLEGSP